MFEKVGDVVRVDVVKIMSVTYHPTSSNVSTRVGNRVIYIYIFPLDDSGRVPIFEKK